MNKPANNKPRQVAMLIVALGALSLTGLAQADEQLSPAFPNLDAGIKAQGQQALVQAQRKLSAPCTWRIAADNNLGRALSAHRSLNTQLAAAGH